MKKFLCLLLSIVMVMSIFTACGEGKKDETAKKDDEDSSVMSNDSKKALSVTELADIAKEISNGSLVSSEAKITVESNEDIEDMPEFLSRFGWTKNKIGLSLKVSALTTADEKCKFSINLHGENDEKIVGLNDIIIEKEVIFVPTAAIDEILGFVSDLAKEAGEGADASDAVINSLKDTYKGKKFIQIDVASLISMAGGMDSGVTAEDFDIEELFNSVTGVKFDEFMQIIKDLYNNETLKTSAEKVAEKFNFVTADNNSVNVKFNEKDIIPFADSIVAFVSDNAEIFADEIFDVFKNSYDGDDKEEMFNDDSKKEVVDKFSSLKTEWAEEKKEIEEFVNEFGLDFNAGFTVNESDNSIFDSSADITFYDKTESGNKISFTSKSSVSKSNESISAISAADCISVESFLAQIGNLYGGDTEGAYEDDYDYGYEDDFDFDAEDDYDFDFEYDDDADVSVENIPDLGEW